MDSVLVPLGSLGAEGTVAALALGGWDKRWTERDVLNPDLVRDVSNPPGPWHQNYVVVVHSLGRLREVLPLFSAEGRAKQVLAVIESDEPAQPFLHGLVEQSGETLRLGTLDGFPSIKVIGLRTTGWLDIHGVLSTVAGQGRRSLPLGGLRMGITDATTATWAVADPQARWTPESSSAAAVDPVDSVDVVVRGSQTVVTDLLPPTDPFASSPIGFNTFPAYANARLVPLDGGNSWRLDAKGTGRAPQAVFDARTGGFTETHIGQLRDFGRVHVDRLDTVEPWAAARFLSQLAVSGVPVTFGEVAPQTKALLGRTVFEGLQAFASCGASPLARESASITSRRAALRNFLPRYRGGELRRRSGLPALEEPTISVLLATKRPGMVAHALAQIDAQTLPQVETILILHGMDELGANGDAAVAAFSRPLRVLHVPAGLTLGGVLNAGIAAAGGTYVAKMDDDDWYGPHHLEDLFLAREYSDATLVGSPVEFTYLEGLDITTRRSHPGEQYTRHVAGGTMYISRHDLKSVGGWRNTPSAVDRGLIDAVLASGGRVYRNHGQNYLMHRRPRTGKGPEHTWQADDSVFLQDVREQWNGFHPAPQLGRAPREPSQQQRSPEYRSWFSTRQDAPQKTGPAAAGELQPSHQPTGVLTGPSQQWGNNSP